MVRCQHRTIVFVMNNGIYALEQANIDPGFFTGDAPLTSFNRLDPWDYAAFGKALGAWTAVASTLGELDAALTQARTQPGPSLIEVRLAEKDFPPQMVRLTASVQAGSRGPGRAY
jgi:indolepyruvate decarboxylase